MNYFPAHTFSYSDYYPFGMLMPNRYGSDVSPSEDYVFGFNGALKDDEVFGKQGTNYDLGARTYDTRIGRMRSPDPWEDKYAWQSSYAYYANCPIKIVDWKGYGDGKYYDENGCEVGDDGKDDGKTYVKDEENGDKCYNGELYKEALDYHSAFGDEQKEAPSKYTSIKSGEGLFSEKTIYEQTKNARHLQFGSTNYTQVLFWYNSGYKCKYDYKNHGKLKSFTENDAINAPGGILMNRNQLGMVYWGYAAGYAYAGDKWSAYKRLASDNKWMHLSIEGNSDEWGEVYAWTYGFFLSKNGGKYYPELSNDIAKAMLIYYGGTNYKNIIYPYGAKKEKPVREGWAWFVEALRQARKVGL